MSDDTIVVSDSFIVNLNSKSGVINNAPYNSNVIFQFSDAIIKNDNSIIMYCSLLNFTCPNSIYTINETNSIGCVPRKY